MEIFDELDCRGGKTGERIARDDAHRSGVWHGAFHCLLVNGRGGRGRVLFQKRSARKKIAPGKFDVSVGGHYASDESAREAGPREIREELGLEVKFEELVPLGRRIFVYCFDPGVMEHEFQDVFLLPREVGPGELSLQQEELDGVIEMNVEEGISLFSGKTVSIGALLHKPDRSQERVAISAGDFVPCLDQYYLKLLLLSKRYISGERELLVI